MSKRYTVKCKKCKEIYYNDEVHECRTPAQEAEAADLIDYASQAEEDGLITSEMEQDIYTLMEKGRQEFREKEKEARRAAEVRFVLLVQRYVSIPTGSTEPYALRKANRLQESVIGPFRRRSNAEKAMLRLCGTVGILSVMVVPEKELIDIWHNRNTSHAMQRRLSEYMQINGIKYNA